MTEFKSKLGVGKDGEPTRITIASGPVVIEGGKVLLDKHGDDKFWKFPGGRMHDDESMKETAMREVREELGLKADLSGNPFIVAFDREDEGVKEHIILIHYLAKRVGEPTPGRDVTEWNWFPVNKLPDDCAPNIKQAVEYFLGRQSNI